MDLARSSAAQLQIEMVRRGEEAERGELLSGKLPPGQDVHVALAIAALMEISEIGRAHV